MGEVEDGNAVADTGKSGDRDRRSQSREGSHGEHRSKLDEVQATQARAEPRYPIDAQARCHADERAQAQGGPEVQEVENG